MENNFSIILATRHKKISDVYEATGIAKSTLTRFYYGRVENPSSATLIKIAKYLDCSIDELLGLKPYVVEV